MAGKLKLPFRRYSASPAACAVVMPQSRGPAGQKTQDDGSATQKPWTPTLHQGGWSDPESWEQAPPPPPEWP